MELTTVTPLTVMPAPETATVLPVVKLVPASVTGTVVPRCANVEAAGVTEVNVAAGGLTTVKAPVRVLVAPIGVVTLTFLAVSAAPAVIAQLALMVVAVDVIPVHVTPAPDIVTADAPVRLVPISVTGTVVPRAPEVGAIEVSVGPCTVNAPVKVLVPPFGVVAATFLAESVAVAVMTQFALMVVALVPVTVQVTPVPDMVTAVAPCRSVPVSVTGTVVPRTPVVGLIEASVGPVTVNGTVLLVPPGPVTVTVLAPSVAPAVIVKVAVTEVSLATLMALAVTPVPEMVTPVVPARPLPVRVTVSLVPLAPVLGAIEVSTGPVTVNPIVAVPPGVVTLTVRAPSVAAVVIVKVAVI